jgi:uncharacterized protein (TIGR02444 family)
MSSDQPLSEFALQVYACPGVAEQLLALQDEDGLDVLLLLCAIWGSRHAVSLTPEAWAQLVAEHRPVQDRIIAPLRQTRRSARDIAWLGEEYERLKALEVAIELRQLDVLQARCRALGDAGTTQLADALLECCRSQSVVWSSGLEARLSRLSTLLG